MQPVKEDNTSQVQLSLIAHIKYMIVRTVLLAIVRVSGLDGLYRFGRWFGYCEYLLQHKRRARIYRRMDQIYDTSPAKAKKRVIARDFFARVRCDKMIYIIMDRIDRDELLGRLETEGTEHLDRAFERGKGTFLMFSHQGSHHLGGILLILRGYPLIGLRDPRESPLRRYVQNRFEKSFPEFRDLQIIPANGPARPYFHAFKSNRIVAAAMDVWRDRGMVRTVDVEVFGETRQFVSGMTHIALRSRAVVVVGFVLSLPRYRYKLVFHPWLIDPDTGDDSGETVQQVMQEYATLIENHTRKYPSHISKTK